MGKLRIVVGSIVLGTIFSLMCCGNAYAYTDEEIDLMARVVMSEASILNDDAKQIVAECIINRAEWYNQTIEETVNNGLSTEDNGTPTIECYEAVYAAIKYNALPDDLLYFRTDYPHNYGYVYAHIGNTYFNTVYDYDTLEKEAEDNWPKELQQTDVKPIQSILTIQQSIKLIIGTNIVHTMM